MLKTRMESTIKHTPASVLKESEYCQHLLAVAFYFSFGFIGSSGSFLSFHQHHVYFFFSYKQSFFFTQILHKKIFDKYDTAKLSRNLLCILQTEIVQVAFVNEIKFPD